MVFLSYDKEKKIKKQIRLLDKDKELVQDWIIRKEILKVWSKSNLIFLHTHRGIEVMDLALQYK